MAAWSEGYVADIPYSPGFYRETTPAHLAFTALCLNREPGRLAAPRRALELGTGVGHGFAVTAAANPGTQFEGVDFNPLHVVQGRRLIEAAGLENATLREASFEDLAREAADGRHDLDLVTAHGIFSWIPKAGQAAIVDIARARLAPGGLLYVSYNCMPGWAPVLPLRRLLRESSARAAGRSDHKIGAGLELAKALMAEGATYFVANPAVAQRFDRLMTLDRTYLAHEYLNANWQILDFADVAAMFETAKLGYVGSATLVENLDVFSVPPALRARVGAETDPIFRETLRDLACNKQFRRDLYGRGLAPLVPAEQAALLNAQRFALAVPRARATFKFAGPLGELDGNAEVYGALADLLARGPARFGEIAALPAFATGGASAALQAVTLLVHGGQAVPLPQGPEPDVAPARRLNRAVAAQVRQGRIYNFLAAPVAGSGIQASNVELYLLDAVLEGVEEGTASLSKALLARMEPLGVNWTHEGQPVTEPSEKQRRAEVAAEEFRSEKLPLWRQLGVL